MAKVTKKYLQERCFFKDKTVIKTVDFDGLWGIVKQLDEDDQHSIFRISDVVIKPLTENQIDSLFAYMPNEVRENLNFLEMTKQEKLKMVRDNTEELMHVIEKKGFTERIDLDSNKKTEEEIYSSERLWDIIKTDKYNLS